MRNRRAFTLVEMMIAMVIAMMMIFAMVQAFAQIGEATTDGRAVIEMLGQLRAAKYRLEQDLNGLTVPLRPWADANSYPGYFEIVEGRSHDNSKVNSQDLYYYAYDDNQPANNAGPGGASVAGIVQKKFDFSNSNLAGEYQFLFGDVDDVLMFTARSDSEPFRGRYNDSIIESNLAEIIWWVELNREVSNAATEDYEPGRDSFTLRRRVLLIRPDLNVSATGNVQNPKNYTFDEYLQANDISLRPADPNNLNNGGAVANSLGDLCFRHNRTAHGFKLTNNTGLSTNEAINYYNDRTSLLQLNRLPTFDGTTSQGEDIMLTNVLAFDLRVWDPNVPVVDDDPGNNYGTEALVPGDPGYIGNLSNTNNVLGQGAYVDLGILYNSGSNIASNSPYNSILTGKMNDRSFLFDVSNPAGNPPFNYPYVYDTWTIGYEKDGYDQDGDQDTINNIALVDEGTNGLDDSSQNTSFGLNNDNGQNGPDDISERETSPPYPVPLKSFKVSIRMYEPSTRQVRQMSHIMEDVR